MYQPVRGMRDFFPEEMRKRQHVIGKIERVFQLYGFEPLDTPALESQELLKAKGGGGEEILKEIYAFNDQGGRGLGLRFDFTVPAARVIASNSALAKPFKRYQIGKVWRYDRPQAGRYREFTQADIDIFGVVGVEADWEVLDCTIAVFEGLGFKEFKIRVNNKKILEALMEKAGIPGDKRLDALRALDKLDKIGWEGVEGELKAREVPGDELIKLIKANKPLGEGKEEIEKLLSLAGEKAKYLEFDLSLVRGLEYYTGNVFEVVAGGQWSCGGGGRYDELIGLYGGKPTPAVGVSYGVERVIQLMDEQGLLAGERNKVVFVAAVRDEVRGKAREIVAMLRDAGVASEYDLLGRNLRKQFDYCNAKGINKVVIAGPKELAEGMIVLRDMESGEEWKIRLKALIKKLS